MASPVAAVDHRKRPRRRGAALEGAILDAVLAVLGEVGYARLSVERVAERAGASKASLYRRWPSKVELVMDAVYQLLPDPATPPDTGSLRSDLLAVFGRVAEQLAGPAGQAMGGVMSDALTDPELARRVRSYARGASQEGIREIVRRAVERGEVDPAVVTERKLEAGHALLRNHFLTRGAPIPDEYITEIVDEVVLPLLQPGRGAPPA
ncbi:MAG TPA: TetR/AcrR family transcriptional regulator [Pseudonocardia sp.]|uniref:TetR/AcrR family transcriptional regulator n=1 Tax=Pseudonocardia sp. TaxID=60912 RepID=UPI002B4AD280|nr:TetR/AcrR family transcriptional regulator [Pseudonocardia sp.]HLU56593.1 TetR/AcrR family transcriptional regulator [Pseudonocardia sp.]